MDLRLRSLLPASLLGLGLLLAACGGSSSTASSSTSTTAMATTTTVPTAAEVGATCQSSASALDNIATTIKQTDTTIDYTTLDNLISSAVPAVQKCQSAMQAAVAGLPAAAQAPARAYATALGGLISALQSPPTSAAGISAWMAQLSSAEGPLQAAQSALAQADPAFNF